MDKFLEVENRMVVTRLGRGKWGHRISVIQDESVKRSLYTNANTLNTTERLEIVHMASFVFFVIFLNSSKIVQLTNI